MPSKSIRNLTITITAIICFLGMTLPGFSQSVDDLIIMTEQYPPYNFIKNGKLMGIAVDTMDLMLEKTNSRLKRNDIKILPWARGYSEALNSPNTCLFSTTRTNQREKLFKWVGPVGVTKIVVLAKKSSSININTVTDLNRFQIGVIRDDVAAQTLIEFGVNPKNLQGVSNTVHNIKKLNAGRIDLWGYGEDIAKWELKSNGFDPNDYETVYIMKTKDFYYAFNLKTPQSLINILQKALDQIKEEGDYQKILDTYIK